MDDATSLRTDIERLCVKRNATLGNMRRDLQSRCASRPSQWPPPFDSHHNIGRTF